MYSPFPIVLYDYLHRCSAYNNPQLRAVRTVVVMDESLLKCVPNITIITQSEMQVLNNVKGSITTLPQLLREEN